MENTEKSILKCLNYLTEIGETLNIVSTAFVHAECSIGVSSWKS